VVVAVASGHVGGRGDGAFVYNPLDNIACGV
jgi:hypothetical protein